MSKLSDDEEEKRVDMIQNYTLDWAVKTFCAWGVSRIFAHLMFATKDQPAIRENAGRGGNAIRTTVGQVSDSACHLTTKVLASLSLKVEI